MSGRWRSSPIAATPPSRGAAALARRAACDHSTLRSLERRGLVSLEPAAEQAWVDYVYFRDNPAGLHREHWHHSAGCHAWLVVTRNITTHEIVAVEFAEKGGSK